MKKLLLVAVVICFVLGTMIACSSQPTGSEAAASSPVATEENASSQSADAETTENVTLELWYYWDGTGQEVLNRYVDMFNEQSDGVSVVATYVPYAEYTQKVLTSAAAGEMPDILIYGNNETSTLAEAGILGVMTQAVKDGGFEERILPEVLKAHEYNGEYYGLPIYGNCLALFYNKAMISEPPATWDDLMTVAAEVTTPDCYALAVSAVESEEGVFQFLPWLWSAGADLDTLNSENGIAALTLYKDLVDKGYMSKEVLSWTQQDAMVQFSSGRAAMMVNGPWNVAAVQAAAPDMDFAVTVLPALHEGGSASILGGESFGITVGANVQAAGEFFNWLFGTEVYMNLLKDNGQLPAEKALLMDPYYQNDPIQKAFADNLLVAKPRAYGPQYNEMSKALQTAISAVLSGMKTPAEAMAEAAAIVDPLLNH